MNELPEGVYSEIVRLCAAGDELAKTRDHQAALAEYNKAWMLVPEPKSEWEASTCTSCIVPGQSAIHFFT